MPRTKVQRQTSKRNRNSDEDGLKIQLKEMQRIHDEFESESTMIWQRRKEQISDLFKEFRCNLSHAEMEMTMGEFMSGKSLNSKSTESDTLLTETNGSGASKLDDDGTYTLNVY